MSVLTAAAVGVCGLLRIMRIVHFRTALITPNTPPAFLVCTNNQSINIKQPCFQAQHNRTKLQIDHFYFDDRTAGAVCFYCPDALPDAKPTTSSVQGW